MYAFLEMHIYDIYNIYGINMFVSLYINHTWRFLTSILNWRIIACIGFCCTTTWVSFKYTCVPSVLSLPLPTHIPPPMGHHRALFWAPCVLQQLPFAVPFTHGGVCIHQSYSLTLSFPCYVHKSILHICVSIPIPQKIHQYTTFLDPYMCMGFPPWWLRW